MELLGLAVSLAALVIALVAFALVWWWQPKTTEPESSVGLMLSAFHARPFTRLAPGPVGADLATYMEVDDGVGNALHVLGNVGGVLLASAARTATVLGQILANPYARGILLFVNVTAVSGTTPTLAIRLNGIDPVTGATYIIQTFANITATGEYVYVVYPAAVSAQSGITAVLNSLLPGKWSVDSVIGGTTPSFTYSLSYQLAN